MSITREEVLNWIEQSTMLEIAQLVKDIETKFGVSAAAAAPIMVGAAAPGAAAAAVAEEKTEFEVVLKEVGAEKIKVIKVVREVTSLGLKEAKDVAETAGSKVLEAVSKEVANDAKGKLEAAGAAVEVK